MSTKNKRKYIAGALLAMLTAVPASTMIVQAEEVSAVEVVQKTDSIVIANDSEDTDGSQELSLAEDVDVSSEIVSDIEEEPASEPASEEILIIAEGECGPDAIWTLDSSGVLTISGTGAIAGIPSEEDDTMLIPWEEHGSLITEICIEDGITDLGVGIFQSCDAVKKITIPGSVQFTSLDSLMGMEDTVEHLAIGNAFYHKAIGSYSWGKETLKTVELLDGVDFIGGSDFYAYNSLTTVVIPQSVAEIGQDAFSSCENLKDVTIAEGVTSIGSAAFANCSNLEAIVLPDSVETIGGSIFAGCISLKEAVLPSGIQEIPNDAFSWCTSLTAIDVPYGVNSIGEWAFYNCVNLETAALPETVSFIGKEAFCSSGIKEISIPYVGVSLENGIFKNCKSLQSVVLPDTLNFIGEETFYGCSSLTEIEIPNTVLFIPDSAFAESGVVFEEDSDQKIGLDIFFNKAEEPVFEEETTEEPDAAWNETQSQELTKPDSLQSLVETIEKDLQGSEDSQAAEQDTESEKISFTEKLSKVSNVVMGPSVFSPFTDCLHSAFVSAAMLSEETVPENPAVMDNTAETEVKPESKAEAAVTETKPEEKTETAVSKTEKNPEEKVEIPTESKAESQVEELSAPLMLINMSAPRLLSVSTTSEGGAVSHRLEWQSIEQESYCILRKTDDSDYEQIAKVTADSECSVYTDFEVAENTSYTYTVYRENLIGDTVRCSEYDAEGITVFNGKTNCYATCGNRNADISWDSMQDADGYVVCRKTNTDDESWTEVVKLSGADSTTYQDTYVNSFTDEDAALITAGGFVDPSANSLVYTVKAYQEKNGKYAYSDYDAEGSYSLAAPSVISVVKNEEASATIEWGTVANADWYFIYAGTPDYYGNIVWKQVSVVKAGDGIRQGTTVITNRNHTSFTVKAAADQSNGGLLYSDSSECFTLAEKDYSDKNILFLGDSITHGTPYGSGAEHEVFSYPWRVGQVTGANCYNPSIPGATYAYKPHTGTGTYRYRLITDVVEKIRSGETPDKSYIESTQRFKDFDVVVLAAGTNDYTGNIPLGELDSTDISQFSGAVNTILQYIAEANVERALLGEAPIKVVFVDLFYANKTKSPEEITNRFITENELGLTLTDYQNTIDQIVRRHQERGMQIYQFETDQIVTAENCAYTTTDNLHMTKATYAQIGNELSEYLIDNGILD